jgi:hypothetical protein
MEMMKEYYLKGNANWQGAVSGDPILSLFSHYADL